MAVPEYEIRLDQIDWRWLCRHEGTLRCFEGALRTGGNSWPIWIGYRGRYSRWFRKPSFDIWFDADRAFDGHLRLHLNAAYRDPSLLRGRLAFEVFQSIDVPTPAAWHVDLFINGEPMGLYTALESVDGAWFNRNGLPPGAIYYAVGYAGNFGLLDPDTGRRKRSLAEGYEKCYPADDQISDLEELIYGITLPSDADFETGIAQHLDVENVLRWLIGLEFTSHTDGVVQNYALIRPDGGRWQISPWDCDGTWGRIPNGRLYPPDEMEACTGQDNYLAGRLLASTLWRKRYLELWDALLTGPLALPAIEARLQALYVEIRAHALADDNKRMSDATFRKEPALIRRYIADRTAYLKAQIGKARRSS